MRISSALYFQTGLNSINRQQKELVHVFQQLGSGKRIVNPADDPLASAQIINLNQSQTMNARFTENRHVGMRNLGEEENVLMQLIPQVSGAKTRVLEAANGTLSDADRTILAGVFEEMRDSIANLANAKDANGQYLFSGSQGTTAPFERTATGSFVYAGDTMPRLVQADPTRQLSISDHGLNVFSRATPGSNTYITGADVANQGAGVIGGVNITNPLEAAEVSSFSIEVLGENGPISITPHGTGTFQTITVTDYDPTKTNTIQLGQGVTVELSGNLKEKDAFTLQHTQTGVTADQLNLLNTLNDIAHALKQPIDGNPRAKAQLENTLNSAMQKLDINYDNILTVRASVGARMNEIEALNATGSLQALHLSSEISRLGDLDFYSASTQLELRTSALEAAALAFKKIQSTNLFTINARG